MRHHLLSAVRTRRQDYRAAGRRRGRHLRAVRSLTTAQAANPLELNFWLSGPKYDGRVADCAAALSTISSQFQEKESTFWNSALAITGFDRVHETAFRPWASDNIPRRYCSAHAMLNDGKPLLSKASFAEMVGPVWTFNGSNGDDSKGYFKAYGLGVPWLDDGKGGKWFGHVGEAYSLRAGFWINPEERRGFIRYVTMVNEFAPVGHCFDRCP